MAIRLGTLVNGRERCGQRSDFNRGGCQAEYVAKESWSKVEIASAATYAL